MPAVLTFCDIRREPIDDRKRGIISVFTDLYEMNTPNATSVTPANKSHTQWGLYLRGSSAWKSVYIC